MLAATALALSALMLSACSSGKAAPRVAQLSTTPETTTSPNSALHAAGQCLRAHGVPNVPDPVVATDGPAKGEGILDKQALKSYPDSVSIQAITACSAAIAAANIATGSSSTNITQQQLQARLTLARCIRAHGVPNFPDPNPTTGDVTPPPGLTKTSPRILAAIQACPSQAQAAGLSPGES
ncbi:MAG TPA: hypothetical protein VK662_15910 [Acidothermaceae bacterium]|jgi:hypothetical protein|nr:hypothetical protein [Acidothermaceae bacterium]